MSHTETVIIVGGGIIGGSIALELANQGYQCTVYDKGNFFQEATTASAGMLCPQAEMFDSPEHRNLFQEAGRVHQPWIDRLEEMSGITVQKQTTGMLRVALSEEKKTSLHYRSSMTEAPGEWLSPQAVHALEPDVSEDNRGGVFFPEDGQLHPVHLAKSLYHALLQAGVILKPHQPVNRLLTDQQRVTGVRTSAGDAHADYMIVAAGAWSASLFADIGIHLPVFPIKGQMCAVRCPSAMIRHVVQGEHGIIIPREDGTLAIGVTHEKVGYEQTPDIQSISDIQRNIIKDVPSLKKASFIKTWAGLRPGLEKAHPVIGAPSGWEGIYAATGHYSVGILLAPLTAILIKEMIMGESLSIDNHWYHPDRYREDQ